MNEAEARALLDLMVREAGDIPALDEKAVIRAFLALRRDDEADDPDYIF